MTRTLEDLLDDNFACRDPKAGAWISAARLHLRRAQAERRSVTKAQREALERALSVLGQSSPGIGRDEAIRKIRALIDQESKETLTPGAGSERQG